MQISLKIELWNQLIGHFLLLLCIAQSNLPVQLHDQFVAPILLLGVDDFVDGAVLLVLPEFPQRVHSRAPHLS